VIIEIGTSDFDTEAGKQPGFLLSQSKSILTNYQMIAGRKMLLFQIMKVKQIYTTFLQM